MAYYPYYAPYARPTGYYNPSIPQEIPNVQNTQQFQQMQMQQASQPAPNDMVFVLNETEATAFPVAPNNSVTLWDKNKPTIYIKSVNMQGVPSMRIFDYTERTAENINKTNEKLNFVSVDVFERLRDEFEKLRNELEDLKAKTATKAAEEVKDE